jgi:hypothetical protein
LAIVWVGGAGRTRTAIEGFAGLPLDHLGYRAPFLAAVVRAKTIFTIAKIEDQRLAAIVAVKCDILARR